MKDNKQLEKRIAKLEKRLLESNDSEDLINALQNMDDIRVFDIGNDQWLVRDDDLGCYYIIWYVSDSSDPGWYVKCAHIWIDEDICSVTASDVTNRTRELCKAIGV